MLLCVKDSGTVCLCVEGYCTVRQHIFAPKTLHCSWAVYLCVQDFIRQLSNMSLRSGDYNTVGGVSLCPRDLIQWGSVYLHAWFDNAVGLCMFVYKRLYNLVGQGVHTSKAL